MLCCTIRSMGPRFFLSVLAALLAWGQAVGREDISAPGPHPALFAAWDLQRLQGGLHEVLKDVPGAECRLQMLLLMQGLSNFSDWALAMADATGKPGAGLLRGNLRALGDMDLCLAAEALEGAAEGGLRGKFCLASLHADTHDAHLGRLLDVATCGRRGRELRRNSLDAPGEVPWKDFPIYTPVLERVELGVCVPSACSGADVEAALKSVFSRVLAGTPLRLDIHVPEHACRTRQGPQRPLGPAHYAFLVFFGTIFVLIFTGTIYDVYETDLKNSSQCVGTAVLRAFSLRTSWRRLTSERGEELSCATGLRALSTIVALHTHAALQKAQEPVINRVRFSDAVKNKVHMPILNSIHVVNTFFTMSGILRSYNIGDAVVKSSFSYMMSFRQRFTRVIPVYFIIVWFYTTFFEFLGDGPFWGKYIGYSVKCCRENWIYNILHITNFVNVERLCMAQSWHMSADMQLFLLAPLVVVPLFRWNRGRLLLVVFISVSMAVTAIKVSSFRLYPTISIFNSDYEISQFLSEYHLLTSMHVTPYLVGLGTGYILNRSKGKKIFINKFYVAIGWIATACILIGTTFWPHKILQRDYEYNAFENAAFASISQLLCAVGVSWTIFACNAGYGGMLNRLLNCYGLRVLSRLSYAMNLTNFIVFLSNSASRRVPIWVDVITAERDFIGDYALTAMLSLFLYITIESPFYILSRIFFPTDTSKKIEAPRELTSGRKSK